MEQINNDQTIRECSAVLGHQIENIPQLDTSKIILVSEVNPKILKKSDFCKHLLNAGTFITVPTNQDFYITSIMIAATGTAGAAIGYNYVLANINGIASRICMVPVYPTATSNDINTLSIAFENPLKIDRGTAVTLANGGTVNSLYGTITGFLTSEKEL
jgi:hypothetical protein